MINSLSLANGVIRYEIWYGRGRDCTESTETLRPTTMFDGLHPVERAWLWLAVVHVATVSVLVATSLAQLMPSIINAITSGQVSLLGLWVAMGTGRLSHRLAVALLFGGTLTAVALVLPNAAGTISDLLSLAPLVLFSTAIQIGIIAIPLSLLRQMGWRLVDESETPVMAGGSPLQFRISHLLVLITLVAGMLALRDFVQSFGTVKQTGQIGFPPGFSSRGIVAMVAVFGVTALLLSAAVVTGFWACLGPHRPGYRLTISAVPVTLLCAIPLHIAGGSEQINWAVFISTFMAVVIASLLLLRHLGVRLVKSTSLRNSCPDARSNP